MPATTDEARKTPWTPGPYRLNYQLGRVVNGNDQTIAYLPASFNGTAVGKATGELLAESYAMAELLRRAVGMPFLQTTPFADDVRALLDRIGSP